MAGGRVDCEEEVQESCILPLSPILKDLVGGGAPSKLQAYLWYKLNGLGGHFGAEGN